MKTKNEELTVKEVLELLEGVDPNWSVYGCERPSLELQKTKKGVVLGSPETVDVCFIATVRQLKKQLKKWEPEDTYCISNEYGKHPVVWIGVEQDQSDDLVVIMYDDMVNL